MLMLSLDIFGIKEPVGSRCLKLSRAILDCLLRLVVEGQIKATLMIERNEVFREI